MNRRSFLMTTGLVLAIPGAVRAEWAPQRPVNIILPYAAGGGTDAFARAVAAAAEGIVPVPMIVTNKEGAGGITGAVEAAAARPDGETIMITSAGSFLLTTMLRDTPVDPLEDFRIIAQIGDLDPAILVPKDSPFQTLADFVEGAKATPGGLRWAHNGRGGAHHVAGQSFLNAHGLQATDVPFQGGGPTRAAVIGAQVDFGVVGIQQAAGFENELRVLAILAPDRDGIIADVPTADEQGFPYNAVSSPIVAFAPKDTPDDVVAGMEDALRQITATAQFAELMRVQGNVPEFLTGAEAEAKLRALKADTEVLMAELKAEG
ncbi:MAG: tripartite tricarboxylate transporter substrate binding protein [Tabrizicola sp.]|nr:tripartite tricarboxylate transporter substrate binding protein [Tabrizicola sp.]